LPLLDVRANRGSSLRPGNKGVRMGQRRRNWRHGLRTTKFRAMAAGRCGAASEALGQSVTNVGQIAAQLGETLKDLACVMVSVWPAPTGVAGFPLRPPGLYRIGPGGSS